MENYKFLIQSTHGKKEIAYFEAEDLNDAIDKVKVIAQRAFPYAVAKIKFLEVERVD